MPRDLNHELNQLLTRVSRLEQSSVIPISGTADVGYDRANNVTTVDDKVDWGMASGWEPYSKISNIIYDPATGRSTGGGELSTPYGRPESHLMGSMCVITGLVRRSPGAPSLPAGRRHDIPMFGLGNYWRPMTNIPLLCLMGDGDPDPASGAPTGVVSTAWIEVRPGLDPLYGSGVVTYVAGTGACSAGTGWVALQGIFPTHMFDTTGF